MDLMVNSPGKSSENLRASIACSLQTKKVFKVPRPAMESPSSRDLASHNTEERRCSEIPSVAADLRRV